MAVETLTVDGAEIRRETGVGTIRSVDRRDRVVRVEIDADGLRHPIIGWVPTDPGAGAEIAEPGARVRYRVDVRRRTGVDPTIPLADLEPAQKVRDCRLAPADADVIPLDTACRATTEQADRIAGGVIEALEDAVVATLAARMLDGAGLDVTPPAVAACADMIRQVADRVDLPVQAIADLIARYPLPVGQGARGRASWVEHAARSVTDIITAASRRTR